MLIMENNIIPMGASGGHAVAYTIGTIFKSLACRRNTYLQRHPTNNSPTVSNRKSEVAKRHQRLIMRSSKTMCKTSSVASAVWRRPVETKY